MPVLSRRKVRREVTRTEGLGEPIVGDLLGRERKASVDARSARPPPLDVQHLVKGPMACEGAASAGRRTGEIGRAVGAEAGGAGAFAGQGPVAQPGRLEVVSRAGSSGSGDDAAPGRPARRAPGRTHTGESPENEKGPAVGQGRFGRSTRDDQSAVESSSLPSSSSFFSPSLVLRLV